MKFGGELLVSVNHKQILVKNAFYNKNYEKISKTQKSMFFELNFKTDCLTFQRKISFQRWNLEKMFFIEYCRWTVNLNKENEITSSDFERLLKTVLKLDTIRILYISN